MNLVNPILLEKYVDPYLKVRIYQSVLNSCVYISLYPWTEVEILSEIKPSLPTVLNP